MKYPQLVSMPSAVSDWLEEQLEARGIDAVVYTRYVLSLLYRDPVDIICPDQDLHITNPNKEVRRAGGGRKRFCRSNDYTYWGRYADADRLKRSAAVECLKSASDQKCGIESLVDELCAKLKDIPNDSTSNDTKDKEDTKPIRIPKKVSEKDSAKRYYAAFPALARNSAASSSSPKLVHLIPKWFGSPKRRLGKKPESFDGKLHTTFRQQESDMKARSLGKQKFNYFTRSNHHHNNNNFKEFQSKKDMAGYNRNKKESEFVQGSKVSTHPSQKSLQEEEQDMDMRDESLYADLPVDIRDLLDTPSPPAMHVDLINISNMTNTGSNKFIQCGTNIISSIWSTSKEVSQECEFNVKDTDVDNVEDKFASHDPYLDYKFSNIHIDHNIWSAPLQLGFFSDREDEHLSDNWSYKMERWSDGYDHENQIWKSLLKLNHHPQDSCFTEVKPKTKFPKMVHPESPKRQFDPIAGEDNESEEAKEDLLVSASSHFKPINEKVETKPNLYADGTTFAIHANLDEISFQRSDTGTMFLQEQGCTKRYLEYKKTTESELAMDFGGFTLKFNVNQNDKACQTDIGDADEDCELTYNDTKHDELYFSGLGGEDYSDAESFSEQQRPDSMMAELFGKEHKCEQCNKAPWSHSPANSTENIWNGEICMTCLRVSNDHQSGGSSFKITPFEERQQLREDIKEDGEQLLSDLSSYMAEEQDDDLPSEEDTCDINSLIYSASGNGHNGKDNGNTEWKELKIKHNGGVPIHSASFSFATRLQQDCLLKMATIPTLRSVTL